MPSRYPHRFALALLMCACGGSSKDAPDAAPPTANRNIAVVRVESWPAGGRELTVRVQDDNGAAMAGDLSASFELSWPDATAADFAAAPAILEPGVTAILVAPADTEPERAEQVAALRAFIAARPATERIALYRWGTNVDQVSSFSRDRERLDGLVPRSASEPDADPMSSFAALALAGAEVVGVGGQAPRTMRALVVLGGTPPPDLSAMPVSVAPVIWVDGQSAPTDGMMAASTHIDALAASAHYTVALCGPTADTTVSLSIGDGSAPLPVPLPSTLPEQATGSCDPDAIGPGKRSYTDRIELVFTSAQRSVYDQRVAANSKADFEVSVRLAPGEDLVPVVAHLRGAGSLACRRRSYTIDIDGNRPRYLMPDSATDEVYLLSMCPDDRYVNQYTANQLMAEQGMWPIGMRYVEVHLDGVTQGVYLMLEKVREELVADDARVRAVLRRRFAAPDDHFELKWERDGISGVQALEDVITDLQGKSGAALKSAADSVTDLDAYLRFVAMQTLLGNGDYVDETWWWSTDARGSDGSVSDYFSMMAWDADDLFSPCHYAGAYAVVDPNELVFCAEARIDHLFLGDAVVYERYVGVLEQLLAEITPARFDAALQKTRDDIAPFLAKPGLCMAMIRLFEANPAVADPVECQRDVQAKLDTMKSNFAARHADLLAKAAAFRSSQ